jgi:NAD(P)-dependent dehydrogenase (short-subunit alcohol dehydrogenase family)
MSARPVALVTGARRGIGRAIAEALADAGYDLALFDRERPDEAEAACRRRGAATLVLERDLSRVDSHADTVEAVAERFGRLDSLVNNAGIGARVRGDMLDLVPENFDAVLAVNLRGTLFLTHAVARWMLAHPRHDGAARSIVTVTSVSAAMANPERVEYCVSKAALSMWLKALAVRLAPEDIGVFEVRPGVIRTEMTSGVAARYEGLIANGLVPSRRWGEAVDVAKTVVALVQPGLSFATGTVINVDGAMAVPRF